MFHTNDFIKDKGITFFAEDIYSITQIGQRRLPQLHICGHKTEKYFKKHPNLGSGIFIRKHGIVIFFATDYTDFHRKNIEIRVNLCNPWHY